MNATSKQQAQFFFVVHTHINIAEKALYMERDELINLPSFEGMKGVALAYLVTPGGRQLWGDVKDAVGADIREELEQSIRDNPKTPEVGEFFRALQIEPSLSASVGESGGGVA